MPVTSAHTAGSPEMLHEWIAAPAGPAPARTAVAAAASATPVAARARSCFMRIPSVCSTGSGALGDLRLPGARAAAVQIPVVDEAVAAAGGDLHPVAVAVTVRVRVAGGPAVEFQPLPVAVTGHLRRAVARLRTHHQGRARGDADHWGTARRIARPGTRARPRIGLRG